MTSRERFVHRLLQGSVLPALLGGVGGPLHESSSARQRRRRRPRSKKDEDEDEDEGSCVPSTAAASFSPLLPPDSSSLLPAAKKLKTVRSTHTR